MKELRRDIRKLGTPDQLKELKSANATVARLVVDAAKGKASTRPQRRAAATLKVPNSVYPAVRLGGGFGGALGAEFGANRNRDRVGPSGRRYKGYNQFQAFRGSGEAAGYFLYPAIRENTARIMGMYGDELLKRFNDNGIT